MNLYIITHSWNSQGHEHGTRVSVYTSRWEAEARLNDAKAELLEMLEDNEDAFNYWSSDTEIELYEVENESNFDRYELTEDYVEVRV